MSNQVNDGAAGVTGSRKRWFALAVIVAAQFMVVLDVAIVNVALPSIKDDLNFSQESLQWVITAYAIFFGGVLLLGGRLACSADADCSWSACCCSRSARCSTGWLGPKPR